MTAGGLGSAQWTTQMQHSDDDEILLSMLRTLRTTLNACAEPAGIEARTSTIISNFLSAYTPDRLLTGLGGYGVAAVYEGRWDGPTVLIRSELDGLPIEEERAAGNTLFPNTSHRCGHDGHMAMVAGLAPLLHTERPISGRVVLLFQPAEETGEGAERILADPEFESIKPDYAMALHNVPGFARNAVVYRRGIFASASVGFRLQLEGIAAHAAEPEKSLTPTTVLSRLLAEMPGLSDLENDPYRLLTITHARMGRDGFGVTPGRATLCATLRSASGDMLDQLSSEVEQLARAEAEHAGLKAEVSWVARFPEIRNDDGLVRVLEECCHEGDIEMFLADQTFRWSEDFGHFSRLCPSVYFGLGTGESSAGLHQPDYSFPDEILTTGMHVFSTVLRALTKPVRFGEEPRSRVA